MESLEATTRREEGTRRGMRRRKLCSVSGKVGGNERFMLGNSDGGIERWRNGGNMLQNGSEVKPGQPY